MARVLVCLLAYVCLALPALGYEGHHHDELTSLELGSVHFPVSCAAPVQRPFEQGVALLHSFAFETAEQTFRQVLLDDPRCALAHWGIAKSMWRWGTPDAAKRKQGQAEIRAGKALHAATPRERGYLDALGKFYAHPENDKYKRTEAFNKSMEQLSQKYPEDHEAAAFYAWGLIAADDNDDTHRDRKKAAKILEELFKLEPNHPGVTHYLIHAYDVPGMAEQGLPAARRYAKIAPAAPHALHMPSHIFAQLGLWQEDIDSNLASVAASRSAAATHMGDEGHQFHAMEFLMYAYLQCGRETDARRLIDEVRSLPKMKSMYGSDSDPQVFALVSYGASYVLELHHWEDAAELPLTPGTEFGDDSITYMARAIGEAHRGNPQQSRKNVEEIATIHEQAVAKKVSYADWVDQLRKEAEAWADHAEGKHEEALALLRGIADKQKKEPSE